MKKKKQVESDASFKKFLGLCKESGAFPVSLLRKVNLERGLPLLQYILELKNKYSMTKNPVHAIKAFLSAYRNGFDTPVWVTLWLYEALYKFHRSEGALNLQSLLGLKIKQRRGSRYKTIAEQERNDELAFDILILRKVYNVSLAKAVEIVYQKQFISNYNISSIDLLKISKESILTYYNNNPFIRRIKNDDLTTITGTSDEDKISYFLKEFCDAAIRASEGPVPKISPNEIDAILSPLIKSCLKN